MRNNGGSQCCAFFLWLYRVCLYCGAFFILSVPAVFANDITIRAPEIAENGSVVQVQFAFAIPVSEFEIYANNSLSHTISARDGTTISLFSARMRMTTSGDILVKTKNPNGTDGQTAKKYVQVGQAANIPLVGTTKYTAASTPIKKRATGAGLMMLFQSDMATDNYIDSVTISSGNGSILVKMTPFAAANPYIDFKANFSAIDAQVSVTVAEGFKLPMGIQASARTPPKSQNTPDGGSDASTNTSSGEGLSTFLNILGAVAQGYADVKIAKNEQRAAALAQQREQAQRQQALQAQHQAAAYAQQERQATQFEIEQQQRSALAQQQASSGSQSSSTSIIAGRMNSSNSGGVDATTCISVTDKASSNYGRHLVNNCAYPVAVIWCADSSSGDTCSRGYKNSWNLGGGKSYPVAPLSKNVGLVKYGACKGANTIDAFGDPTEFQHVCRHP